MISLSKTFPVLGAGLVALVPTFASAQAADAAFTAAMSQAVTSVGTYAAALVGLAAVAVVFMIAIKYIKRIPRAS